MAKSEPSVLKRAPEGDDAPVAEPADRGPEQLAKPTPPAPEKATPRAEEHPGKAPEPQRAKASDLPEAPTTAAEPRPRSGPAVPGSARRRRPGPAARPSAPVFHAAGFWRRVAAAAIDLAIVLPVALLLAWLAGHLAGVHLPPSRHRGLDFWLDLLLAHDPALVGAIGLILAIATVYLLVFQITIARTPGMKVLKTRIIDAYGDPPSTGRAVARTAGYLAGVVTLGLGFLWIGFDSEKRGLHDWMSGTHVVKT
jgi:uncharacterized RDD family membrane protein YckC